jgi:hypothetical protein
MCKDIVRSRRNYLLRKEKEKEESDQKNDEQQKARVGKSREGGKRGKAAPKGAGKTAPKGAGKTAPKGAGKTAPKGAGKAAPKGAGKAAPKGAGKAAPKGAGKAAPKDAGKHWSADSEGDEFTHEALESFFEFSQVRSDDDEDPASFAHSCIDCGKSLKLHQCFPIEARENGDALFVRCEMHQNKHLQLQKVLKENWANSQKDRDAQKKKLREQQDKDKAETEEQAQPPASKSARKPSASKSARKPPARKSARKPPAGPVPFQVQNDAEGKRKSPRKNAGRRRKAASKTDQDDFTLDQHCLARWEGNDFYAAQISRVHAAVGRGKPITYDVYFPEDGMTREGLIATDLKHVMKPLPNWAKVTREQFVGEYFVHDDMSATVWGEKPKPGQYKVSDRGGCTEPRLFYGMENYYICQRKYKNGRLSDTIYFFDMGYVQKKILHQIFPLDKTFAP